MSVQDRVGGDDSFLAMKKNEDENRDLLTPKELILAVSCRGLSNRIIPCFGDCW